MTAALIVTLLATAGLAYVLSSLMGEPRLEVSDPTVLAEEADEKKRAALSAIIDLEDEREMGKISEADYRALVAGYEADALAALKQLDEIGGEPQGDDALEAEIASLRQRLECPSCGAARPPGERCPRCEA